MQSTETRTLRTHQARLSEPGRIFPSPSGPTLHLRGEVTTISSINDLSPPLFHRIFTFSVAEGIRTAAEPPQKNTPVSSGLFGTKLQFVRHETAVWWGENFLCYKTYFCADGRLFPSFMHIFSHFFLLFENKNVYLKRNDGSGCIRSMIPYLRTRRAFLQVRLAKKAGWVKRHDIRKAFT